MTPFSIDLPALAGSALDRSEDLRDAERIQAAWPDARVLAIGPGGELPIRDLRGEPTLEFSTASDWGAHPPEGGVLVGSLDGVDYWAVPAAAATDAVASTIRSVGPLLGEAQSELATTAVALLGWHDNAHFCSRCGAPTSPDLTGHSRVCTRGHVEFPRTDPAVIVLVHDGGDNAVLARQPSWPTGRFSVLAGFAEAGESLEATVRREIGEEVGVVVEDLRYLGSQPWPFPRSLMIAFAAQAPVGAPLRPRAGEIDDARWFSRAELRALLADGDSRVGPAPGSMASGPVAAERSTPVGEVLSLPGPVSIARRMVEGFVSRP